MLKLKIKSNFNIFILFLCIKFLFSQGIFIDENSLNVISFSSNYSKHENLQDDYNYSLGLSYLFKGKLQIGLDYEKYSKSNEENHWEEFSSISLGYFFKSKKLFNFSLRAEYSIPKITEISKSSLSFMINSKIYGKQGTGMIYFPFINYSRQYDGDFIKVIKNISDFTYVDFISIGCVMTFNDFWIKPYYEKNTEENIFYEGIEIGFWDYLTNE